MKKIESTYTLKAHNHYCVDCLLDNQELVDATHIIWEDLSQKAIPVCDFHFKMLKEEEQIFWSFSKN